MPEIKGKTVVEFAGGLKDLVIKVGGRIVYSGEEEKKKKSGKTEKEVMGIEQMKMVSKFASCVYKVPALKYVWRKSRFRKTDRAGVNMISDDKNKSGKASTYNKIVSANKRGLSFDLHPNSSNMIIPSKENTLAGVKAILRHDGITIKNDYPEAYFLFPYNKRKMTPVGIICPFDPKEKGETRFEMITKWYDIEEFTPLEYEEFFFPFNKDDVELMCKYRNCIVYIAIVEESQAGRKMKYYDFGSEEFSLSGYPEKEIVFRQDTPVERKMEKLYLKNRVTNTVI